MPAGRPLKFESAEQLQDKGNQYFENCEDTGRPLTISGLALALDCDPQTLLNYERKDEFVGTIRQLKLKIHNYIEERLLIGANVAGSIFNLKNNFGWKDQTDVKVSGNTTLDVQLIEGRQQVRKRLENDVISEPVDPLPELPVNHRSAHSEGENE